MQVIVLMYNIQLSNSPSIIAKYAIIYYRGSHNWEKEDLGRVHKYKRNWWLKG